MTTTGAKVFVDTNILVRANMVSAPFHQQALAAINRLWEQDADLWISRQVLREYIATVTRPQTFMHPIPLEQVILRVENFQTWFHVADETPDVTRQLLELLKLFPTGGKKIHDANIVATMLVNGIDTLLTQNIDDFKRFDRKITLLPLSTSN